jgi:hypothetical protein
LRAAANSAWSAEQTYRKTYPTIGGLAALASKTAGMSFSSDVPAIYRLHVGERLDARWAAWFDDLALATDDHSTTLTGSVADQSALHALLRKLRDLGLVLLSVERLEPPAR